MRRANKIKVEPFSATVQYNTFSARAARKGL